MKRATTIREKVLNKYSAFFSDAQEDRDNLFASLDSYQRCQDRESQYQQSIAFIKEKNIQKGIDLLKIVAEQDHPLACVFLWMYYEKIKEKMEVEQYKQKSQQFFHFIERKALAEKKTTGEIPPDLLIGLEWGYQNGIKKEHEIEIDFSVKLQDPSHSLFSLVGGESVSSEDAQSRENEILVQAVSSAGLSPRKEGVFSDQAHSAISQSLGTQRISIAKESIAPLENIPTFSSKQASEEGGDAAILESQEMSQAEDSFYQNLKTDMLSVGKKVKSAIDIIKEFRDCMQGKGKAYKQATQLLEKIETQLQVMAFLIEKEERAEKIYGAQLERFNELLSHIVNQLHVMTGTEVGSQLKRFAFKASYLTTLKQFSEQIDSEDTQMLMALNTQKLQELEKIIKNIKIVKEKVDEGQQQGQALLDQVQQLIDTIAQIKLEKEEAMNKDQVNITSKEEVREVEGDGHKQVIDFGATPESIAAAVAMASAPLPQRHTPSSNTRVSIRLKEGADRRGGVREGHNFHVIEQPQQARFAHLPAAPQQPPQKKSQSLASPHLPSSGAGRGRRIIAFNNLHAEQRQRVVGAQLAGVQQPHQQFAKQQRRGFAAQAAQDPVDVGSKYLQQQKGRSRLVKRVVEAAAVQAESQVPRATPK
jgi:hypothetical protein